MQVLEALPIKNEDILPVLESHMVQNGGLCYHMDPYGFLCAPFSTSGPSMTL